uniref:Tubulin-specific chaperone A n=1 Tax=Macrostomum lignano TaxID=282301 RepID=A0A1I8JLY8_9PLAT
MSYEETIRNLSERRLKTAEQRATEAEKAGLPKLQSEVEPTGGKELDEAEDELLSEKERYKGISEELDQTFAELTGY